jgi:preprotein translocase subunit SecA
MAGRGTDIALDAAARAAGGLSVISCQHNPSRRLDRQLAGRAARHGEPGSVAHWRCARPPTQVATDNADNERPWKATPTSRAGRWLAILNLRWTQWCEERRRAALRAALLAQERDADRRLAFSGPSD